jgi:hypothetical protein
VCIIVDANSAQDIKARSDDGAPILNWLLKEQSGLVVGGKLLRELVRCGLEPTLTVLSQAGRLHRIDDGKIQPVQEKLMKDGKCHSDDQHVLALAIVSGCRLIFSKDKNLHKDAKNRKLLTPPAAIYQSKQHKHLLTKCECAT